MANVQMNSSFRRGHRRYQSVMAEQFSSQLDEMFNMDSGLDTLVHDVEAKRQSIFVQQRELEELQERIRRADAQIGNSTDEEDDDDESDDSESDNASKAPVRAAEPSRARATTYSARQPSIFAIRETKDEEEEQPKPRAVAPVAAAPIAQKPAADFVMVRRPRPGPRKHPRVDSHIEVSEEDENEEEEDDDDDDEDSEEDSSEEEAAPVRRRR